MSDGRRVNSGARAFGQLFSSSLAAPWLPRKPPKVCVLGVGGPQKKLWKAQMPRNGGRDRGRERPKKGVGKRPSGPCPSMTLLPISALGPANLCS